MNLTSFASSKDFTCPMISSVGKIVAIRKNGEAIITRLRMISKDLALGIPDNPDSIDETVVLRGDEIGNSVIGKVSWWWGRQR